MLKIVFVGLLVLILLAALDTFVTEFRQTWRSLGKTGYPRTPYNLILMAYCRFEAANFQTMNQIRSMLDNNSLNK